MRDPMVPHLAQRAKGILADGTDAHGGVGLHHDRRAAGVARAVHNVSHEVQSGLEQQAVIAGKQLLVHQLLDLVSLQSPNRESETFISDST